MTERLSDAQRDRYAWQIDIPGFGPAGQAKLCAASAMVSRCGGLGGAVCYNLAAAGIGKLVLAHGGAVEIGDLNRQILMTHDWLGKPRVECAARRLREFNPDLRIEAIGANVSAANVRELVEPVDIVFDCAPRFSERFLMNRECVRQNKPMIEAAVFGMEGLVTTIVPGRTPCLACLYPEDPPAWNRRFPVFGAVAALAASVAAMEGIKVLTGFAETLAGTLLYFDAGDMSFRRTPVARRPDCKVCGEL